MHIRFSIHNTGIFFLSLFFVVFSVACTQIDRIVIDGTTASVMENRINSELNDSEILERGNTFSNIRNGGYIISDSGNIYFIHDMPFPDGSTLHYLQKLPVSQIGSLTARNEVVANMNGEILGKFDQYLVYIDEDNERKLTALSLNDYAAQVIFDRPVTSALLLNRTVFLSLADGTLIEVILGVNVSDTLQTVQREVRTGSGTLVGVADGFAYTLVPENKPKIIKIDLASGLFVEEITGGNYLDVQISGSWIYFVEDSQLYRQQLAEGSVPVSASIRRVDEYVTWGSCLAFTSPEGGIFLSHLDGSSIIQLSRDKASGLQMQENQIFYRNAYDSDAIYTIDLVEGIRMPLLGEGITDGGIRFVPLSDQEIIPFRDTFKDLILDLADKQTTRERILDTPSGDVLFVEIPYRSNETHFYRLIDTWFTPEDVSILVIITYKETPLGRYTDGGIAYRVDAVMSVFNPATREALLTWVIPGRPPSEIKIGDGDRYGLTVSWHQRALDLLDSLQNPQ